ncbi:hypothetical protein GN956_G14210 [Arapaima gigas]
MSITDHPDQLLFTVTMRNLQQKDSDIYWCAVEISGRPDDGIFLHLIVNIRETQPRNRETFSGCSDTPPKDPVEEAVQLRWTHGD